PVGVHFELGELAGPVRDVELPRALLRQPRHVAEVGERRLPALDGPVGAVGRLAPGHEPGKGGAVVPAADVAEAAPVELAVLAPAAGVVLLQPDLARGRAREAGVERAPDEHALEPAARPVGDHRLAL